jgi:predicted phosphodiesterase
MKIALASDVHLEFGDLHLKNEQNADVLILSGDICVAADIGRPDSDNMFDGARSSRIADFFKRCSFQFPHVIYIMGNHEHYNGDFATSGNKLKSMLESNMLSNVYFLDKESKVINDVTFIGGTLWTDMNKEDGITMQHVSRRMNDFQICKNSSRQVSYRTFEEDKAKFHERDAYLSPQDAIDDHKQMISYIQTVIEGKFDQKFVVAGHHAPSKSSTHPRYKNEVLMNGAYSSDLNEFILAHPQIKLWTHGHTHEDFDYMIGTTRIVCNPRGYIDYEERAENFQLKYMDV